MSYTKDYYIGSERISAKTGTCLNIGYYPQGYLATKMPNLDENLVRTSSDDKVDKAENNINYVHEKLSLNPPALNSTDDYVEESSNFNHLRNQLDYFYFHPDHLGSSSYITNAAGMVSQHLEYLPFGELLVDEHTNSYNSPFKYNGKEFDEETGNYYYSARYYDPKWSIFISVDPLAEQAPDWTPYRYGFNNPIRYTDPTGMYENDPWYISNEVGATDDPIWLPNDTVATDVYGEGGYTNLGENLLDKVVIEGVTSNATVNVLTETDGIGHTYIQVGDYVFSNGRYNGSDSPSMGAYGVTGDNVLIKYSGQEATDFINSRTSTFPTTIQKVNNVNASDVFSHLNERYNNGTPNTSGSGVVDGRYNLFSRNCTTCTIDALNAGGTNFSATAPSALPIQISTHNSGNNYSSRQVQADKAILGFGAVKR